MQVRQLEHEADARFFPLTKGTVIAISQAANQSLEDQREQLLSEVSSEVWRRDEKST